MKVREELGQGYDFSQLARACWRQVLILEKFKERQLKLSKFRKQCFPWKAPEKRRECGPDDSRCWPYQLLLPNDYPSLIPTPSATTLCNEDTYMGQDDALWPDHGRAAGVTCSDPWECCTCLSPAGLPHSLEGFVQLGSGCLKTSDTQ